MTWSTTTTALVVPVRHRRPDPSLVDHLKEVRATVGEVVLVDGSNDSVYARYDELLGDEITHIPVDDRWQGARNGKVAGVMSGLCHTSADVAVIADDDVRHDHRSLVGIVRRLDDADLVQPQNYFVTEAPSWHVRWDTARSLVNRGLTTDWPGTFGVRRSVLLGAGGYSGDCLFENLEMVRTVDAAGGRVVRAPDLFVARMPPDDRTFLEQRVRQAYDSLAQPARLLAELTILPLVVSRPLASLPLAVAATAIAERGRRRSPSAPYSPTAALWAPLWLTERAICSWLAAACLLTGGIRYGEGRIRRAAHSGRRLRARISSATDPTAMVESTRTRDPDGSSHGRAPRQRP